MKISKNFWKKDLFFFRNLHLMSDESSRAEMATTLLATYDKVANCTLTTAAFHNVLAQSLKKLENDIRNLVPGLLDINDILINFSSQIWNILFSVVAKCSGYHKKAGIWLRLCSSCSTSKRSANFIFWSITYIKLKTI